MITLVAKTSACACICELVLRDSCYFEGYVVNECVYVGAMIRPRPAAVSFSISISLTVREEASGV